MSETQEEADYKKFIKAHDMGYDDIHKSFMQDKSEMETRHKEQSANFGLQMAAVSTDITGDNAGQRRVAKLSLLTKQLGEAEARCPARAGGP